MKTAVCPRCGESWSVLYDGSLVEHPQIDRAGDPLAHIMLCPGSRTKAKPASRASERSSVAPMHVANGHADRTLASEVTAT
jgi:hypothetical protein